MPFQPLRASPAVPFHMGARGDCFSAVWEKSAATPRRENDRYTTFWSGIGREDRGWWEKIIKNIKRGRCAADTHAKKLRPAPPHAFLCARFVPGAPDESFMFVGAKLNLRRTAREDFERRRP
jgi:hypothetical protein